MRVRILVRLKCLVNAIGLHKWRDTSNGLFSSKQSQKNVDVTLWRFTDVKKVISTP